VIPIVTPREMQAIDAAAGEPGDVLIERAGGAVARAAVRMLGGTYGRRIVVIAGKGNNGADGRVAARLLAQRGAQVTVHDAAACPPRLAATDLVVDAAYGTGFRGAWKPPDPAGARILAVDIPSGVDGLTGEAAGALAAERTVTFAALKPGLLFGGGRELAGEVEVADIGLPAPSRAHLVEVADVAEWWPRRAHAAHKWKSALRIVAGSAGMPGAAILACRGAQRAGAGMIHLSAPGPVVTGAPVEVVQRPLPASGWAGEVLGSLDRFHAMVIGPGLGRSESAASGAREVIVAAPVPLVIDGDGLFAVGFSADGARRLLALRRAPTVLTPHDGEYATLAGEPPGRDRLAATRRLAADTGAVVLLKGPTTVVADPTGEVLVIDAGDSRLATAGTGDVLAGMIGALLAGGLDPLRAAAGAAWVHGTAARRGANLGFVAGDLAELVPAVLAGLPRAR
jgi:ADP-dependent NAD(P)H-hydrate dehydratase / NAD(P)H-hydrate epimerase